MRINVLVITQNVFWFKTFEVFCCCWLKKDKKKFGGVYLRYMTKFSLSILFGCKIPKFLFNHEFKQKFNSSRISNVMLHIKLIISLLLNNIYIAKAMKQNIYLTCALYCRISFELYSNKNKTYIARNEKFDSITKNKRFK